LDKIKLYTTNKSNINKSIISNNFNYCGTTFDSLRHNEKITFTNNTTDIVIDKFGLVLKSNPTKYLKDNNLIQIDRQELRIFKEKFEDDLQINTNNFQLTGFDFNIDICTQYPPKSYLGSIRTLPRYSQTIFPYNEGISFINNCKSFIIYDKLKQMDNSGVNIPMEYGGSNLLRLELAVKGKMKQTKNLSGIRTLDDLTQPDKYILAIKEFENIYYKIHKQPIYKFINMNKPDPSIINTNDFALLYFINELGMAEYINGLTQEKDMGLLTYRQWKTRNDKAFQLWNKYSTTDDDKIDLLAEMNQKVNERIMEIKQQAA
jgi:hypothetical protein